ncbi:hypothetical protein [Humidisolicoccus flavus]|uniref:hypothetical protein n=1 Tax=Humidisolicoccus flavus TaxID=3111414 RepID=UPI003253614A
MAPTALDESPFLEAYARPPTRNSACTEYLAGSWFPRDAEAVSISLRYTFTCTPTSMQQALRSPKVMRWVSAPLVGYRSQEQGGFPDRWDERPHRVTLLVLRTIPLGTQTIDLDWHVEGKTWVQEDHGSGLGGALKILHRITVEPDDDGATVFTDTLTTSGPLGALMQPVLWGLWQWRGVRLQQYARKLARKFPATPLARR